MGGAFPFTLPGSDKPEAYYTALIRTPFGDEATLDFARAAIEGENLGRNPAGVTDILGVSLSTHDYVNHGFGPESRVSQDHLLRVDRALAAFFDYLDQRIGLDNVRDRAHRRPRLHERARIQRRASAWAARG